MSGRGIRRARRKRGWWLVGLGLVLSLDLLAGKGLAQFAGLKTDSSRALVPLQEIRSGGPPPDGIPPIDKPLFVSIREANGWLREREPVIGLEVNGEARAYPLQIMTWHEIVNDVVGGVPLAITFCPLCNSALAFDRRLRIQDAAIRKALQARRPGVLAQAGAQGILTTFGTSGLLYQSDLVMYDRLTDSLWAQMWGRAIVGTLAGLELSRVPAQITSYGDWRQSYPQGKVLSRQTGHVRSYGTNPYAGYDRVDQPPFLFSGKLDGRLLPMERVVAVTVGTVDKAYPFRLLAERRVLHDRIAAQELVIFYASGTASALDQPEIHSSRDVGAAGVFDPRLEGKRLEFELRQGTIRDRASGSRWNVLGKAVAGPLKGKALRPIEHGSHFWFAWAAFKPHTVLYQP